MLELVYATQFKKDYKLAKKRNVDTEELVIAMIQKQDLCRQKRKTIF